MNYPASTTTNAEALHRQHGSNAIILVHTSLYVAGDNYYPTGNQVLLALICCFQGAKQ